MKIYSYQSCIGLTVEYAVEINNVIYVDYNFIELIPVLPEGRKEMVNTGQLYELIENCLEETAMGGTMV